MLLTSGYLPPVQYFTKLYAAGGDTVCIEQYDHYVKQTLRNRCLIAGPDGVQALIVPVEKGTDEKCLMRDIRISEHGNWRHQHWKALQTAYASSPFFLYYEDIFRPFYEQRQHFLFDFNLRLTTLVCQLIGLQVRLEATTSFCPIGSSAQDERETIHLKHSRLNDTSFRASPYWQVFAEQQGFLPNLSIADLLFNMGPESIFVLKNSIP